MASSPQGDACPSTRSSGWRGGAVYLWGDRAVYDDGAGGAPAGQTRLPNTDAPLYVNERPVEESLEERMPGDGRR